jgi:hypothetical protein
MQLPQDQKGRFLVVRLEEYRARRIMPFKNLYLASIATLLASRVVAVDNGLSVSHFRNLFQVQTH